jgi:hypothetical protein
MLFAILWEKGSKSGYMPSYQFEFSETTINPHRITKPLKSYEFGRLSHESRPKKYQKLRKVILRQSSFTRYKDP